MTESTRTSRLVASERAFFGKISYVPEYIVDSITEKCEKLLQNKDLIKNRLIDAANEYLRLAGRDIEFFKEQRDVASHLAKITRAAENLERLLAENSSAHFEIGQQARHEVDANADLKTMQTAVDLINSDIKGVSRLKEMAQKALDFRESYEDQRREPEFPKGFDLPKNVFLWRILEIWDEMGLQRKIGISESMFKETPSPLVQFAKTSLLLVLEETNPARHAPAVKQAIMRVTEYRERNPTFRRFTASRKPKG